MTLQDKFLAYLTFYAQKDLPQISAMFAPDILLRDWNISVRGYDAAVVETSKNFQAAATITIEPLRIFEDGFTVAGELKIVVNEQEELYVIDILTFNPAGQISSIRAYLGRAD
jgi:hypothetical protein